jgi:5-oxoprolinase (ATP-hydrolysing)
MNKDWIIAIDTGGTFTDCIAQSPAGKVNRLKILSSSVLRGKYKMDSLGKEFKIDQNWDYSGADIFSGFRFRKIGAEETGVVRYLNRSEGRLELVEPMVKIDSEGEFEIFTEEEAPVLAMRLITQTPIGRAFPSVDLRLGTTIGTNALLEKKGSKVVLLVTRGFEDVCYIGTQQRPHLFQLAIPEPELLYEKVIGVKERLDAAGRVLVELTDEEISRVVMEVKNSGMDSVAICFMHAYLNGEHEVRLKKALQEFGISQISISSEVSRRIKFYNRAQTTLVNSYLSKAVNSYLNLISHQTGGFSSFRVMTSSGGLVKSSLFFPKDSLLSGPAGGVRGSAVIGAPFGIDRLISFDMGGTSTDCARYDGAFDYDIYTKVGSGQFLSNSLSIETVAAGGGSICYYNGLQLEVGPESAGANPGPACYGAGGPLTVTDVNLLLGRLDPDSLGIPIKEKDARKALEEIVNKIAEKTGIRPDEEEVLNGFIEVANEKMTGAIRKISLEKGFDPGKYTLVSFGGAGGLHACGLAERLGIERVIVPFTAGILSAFGIGVAPIQRIFTAQVLKLLQDAEEGLEMEFKKLEKIGRNQLKEEGIEDKQIEISKKYMMLRLQGQDGSLEIPYEPNLSIEEIFIKKHRGLYGFYPVNRLIEIESLVVVMGTPLATFEEITENGNPKELKKGQVRQEDFKVGDEIEGPVLILNKHSTAFIPKGWKGDVKHGRDILLRRYETGTVGRQVSEETGISLFTNRFNGIAEEMGAQLQRSAFSINIKERLDFSCAILDAEAKLLVNAPHVPVHLGSLGICARLIINKFKIGPGDIMVTNHPAFGGSHLPDITLIRGVFNAEGQVRAYLINRAHHAEIGGKKPGSMPPDAVRLTEEGVVIAPFYLIRAGEEKLEDFEQLLKNAPYPTRSVYDNMADIRAGMASLQYGYDAIVKLGEEMGWEEMGRYMGLIRKNAGIQLKKAVKKYWGKSFFAREFLDDGGGISVKISFSEEENVFDFTGTDDVHPGNLNANVSIVYSVVIYFLRILCEEEIPLNDGLMERVRIILPERSFLHPVFSDDSEKCPAVVGGNTEVSQRLTDTLLKAMGIAACSQGTMNNFLFGNREFGFYETICGGVGAVEGANGRSAIHQHMTNTRITDAEEMEVRFPVRVEEFSIRKGSGGLGKWKGGDGVFRRIQFLDELEVTVLSQHRKEAPYGMRGGKNGQCGSQRLIRCSGEAEEMKGIDSKKVFNGDMIEILTPGGGGFEQEVEK